MYCTYFNSSDKGDVTKGTFLFCYCHCIITLITIGNTFSVDA